MAVATVVLTDAEIDVPTGDPGRSWCDIARRAHALLTQTLPDEILDEPTARPAPLEFPPFLFG